jgi:integrative and conjugative element protein (TIGR02256 family)
MMRKFVIDNLIEIIIEDSVLQQLYKYDPKVYDTENGGILLGKVKTDAKQYVISRISIPNKKDKKGKYFFIRNKKEAQLIINQIWADSDGKINYLGEWHTHKQNDPRPSFVDLQLLKQIRKDKTSEFSYVLMIILGNEKDLYVCSIDKYNKIQQLKEE